MPDGDARVDPLSDIDAGLRADIRLGKQLGDTLVRKHGDGLLDTVERIRTLSRRLRNEQAEVSHELAGLLRRMDGELAVQVVRAFTVYFHPANIIKQVHRVEDLRVEGRAGERGIEDCLIALVDGASHRTTWCP